MRKIKSYLHASILGAAILVSGCATTDQQQLAVYLGDARDISMFGSKIALIEKPEARDAVIKARDSLAALESLPDGKVTVDDLMRALSQLPIDQLQSEKGQVYAAGGRVVIRRFVAWTTSSPEIDVGSSGALKQFITAFRQGMDDALASTPPTTGT